MPGKKSEARKTKAEGNPKHEIQTLMLAVKHIWSYGLSILDFSRISILGFRI
jgi:hypothetical protein